MATYCDSTGTPIVVGDKVMFRGKDYTIAKFIPGIGTAGTAGIEFKEKEVHTTEQPDEISVDRMNLFHGDC